MDPPSVEELRQKQQSEMNIILDKMQALSSSLQSHPYLNMSPEALQGYLADECDISDFHDLKNKLEGIFNSFKITSSEWEASYLPILQGAQLAKSKHEDALKKAEQDRTQAAQLLKQLTLNHDNSQEAKAKLASADEEKIQAVTQAKEELNQKIGTLQADFAAEKLKVAAADNTIKEHREQLSSARRDQEAAVSGVKEELNREIGHLRAKVEELEATIQGHEAEKTSAYNRGRQDQKSEGESQANTTLIQETKQELVKVSKALEEQIGGNKSTSTAVETLKEAVNKQLATKSDLDAVVKSTDLQHLIEGLTADMGKLATSEALKELPTKVQLQNSLKDVATEASLHGLASADSVKQDFDNLLQKVDELPKATKFDNLASAANVKEVLEAVVSGFAVAPKKDDITALATSADVNGHIQSLTSLLNNAPTKADIGGLASAAEMKNGFHKIGDEFDIAAKKQDLAPLATAASVKDDVQAITNLLQNASTKQDIGGLATTADMKAEFQKIGKRVDSGLTREDLAALATTAGVDSITDLLRNALTKEDLADLATAAGVNEHTNNITSLLRNAPKKEDLADLATAAQVDQTASNIASILEKVPTKGDLIPLATDLSVEEILRTIVLTEDDAGNLASASNVKEGVETVTGILRNLATKEDIGPLSTTAGVNEAVGSVTGILRDAATKTDVEKLALDTSVADLGDKVNDLVTKTDLANAGSATTDQLNSLLTSTHFDQKADEITASISTRAEPSHIQDAVKPISDALETGAASSKAMLEQINQQMEAVRQSREKVDELGEKMKKLDVQEDIHELQQLLSKIATRAESAEDLGKLYARLQQFESKFSTPASKQALGEVHNVVQAIHQDMVTQKSLSSLEKLGEISTKLSTNTSQLDEVKATLKSKVVDGIKDMTARLKKLEQADPNDPNWGSEFEGLAEAIRDAVNELDLRQWLDEIFAVALRIPGVAYFSAITELDELEEGWSVRKNDLAKKALKRLRSALESENIVPQPLEQNTIESKEALENLKAYLRDPDSHDTCRRFEMSYKALSWRPPADVLSGGIAVLTSAEDSVAKMAKKLPSVKRRVENSRASTPIWSQELDPFRGPIRGEKRDAASPIIGVAQPAEKRGRQGQPETSSRTPGYSISLGIDKSLARTKAAAAAAAAAQRLRDQAQTPTPFGGSDVGSALAAQPEEEEQEEQQEQEQEEEQEVVSVRPEWRFVSAKKDSDEAQMVLADLDDVRTALDLAKQHCEDQSLSQRHLNTLLQDDNDLQQFVRGILQRSIDPAVALEFAHFQFLDGVGHHGILDLEIEEAKNHALRTYVDTQAAYRSDIEQRRQDIRQCRREINATREQLRHKAAKYRRGVSNLEANVKDWGALRAALPDDYSERRWYYTQAKNNLQWIRKVRDDFDDPDFAAAYVYQEQYAGEEIANGLEVWDEAINACWKVLSGFIEDIEKNVHAQPMPDVSPSRARSPERKQYRPMTSEAARSDVDRPESEADVQTIQTGRTMSTIKSATPSTTLTRRMAKDFKNKFSAKGSGAASQRSLKKSGYEAWADDFGDANVLGLFLLPEDWTNDGVEAFKDQLQTQIFSDITRGQAFSTLDAAAKASPDCVLRWRKKKGKALLSRDDRRDKCFQHRRHGPHEEDQWCFYLDFVGGVHQPEGRDPKKPSFLQDQMTDVHGKRWKVLIHKEP